MCTHLRQLIKRRYTSDPIRGSVTDIDGNYSVDGVDDTTVLVFSYTGYGDQEVLVGTQSIIDVVMSAGELLEEVVVIGYGTVVGLSVSFFFSFIHFFLNTKHKIK